MVATEKHASEGDDAAWRTGLWPSRWRWRISLGLLALVGISTLIAWVSREDLAGLVIEDFLEQYDLQASYDIVSIDPQRQVIANLVIGDPNRPDLTVERLAVNLDYGLGAPGIEALELERPRLFGTYLNGNLSFGSLDRLIFAESDQPPALPAFDLSVIDGRALIETDFGPIAAKIDGEGRLDDGFESKLALTAPGVDVDGCRAQSATAYGDLGTSGGSLSFTGPIRVRALSCKGAVMESADIGASVTVSEDFSQTRGDLRIAARQLGYGDNSLAFLGGHSEFSLGERGLVLDHDLEGERLSTGYAMADRIDLKGSFRSDPDFARSEWRLGFAGEELRAATSLTDPLGALQSSGEGTFIAPLAQKLDRSLNRRLDGASLEGDAIFRTGGTGWRILLPQARAVAANGDTLLAVSRLVFARGEVADRIAGHFITGGEGLPQITGRIDQGRGGRLSARLRMEEYSQGANRLAFPRLHVTRGKSGQFRFQGFARAGGALPGGKVRGLEVPFEGVWTNGTLLIGQRCSDISFEQLVVAQLALRARKIALCPEAGKAMVRLADFVSIGVRTRGLELAGELAQSPASLKIGSAVFRYPGAFSLEDFAAVIGNDGSAVRMSANSLEGTLGQKIGGKFAGGSARLDLVPLDLGELAGNWTYEGGDLVVDKASFVLTERVDGVEGSQARFEPLLAKDATLTLSGDDILANASLLHPSSDRLISRLDIVHDLASGNGGAQIGVPGVTFDESLSPEDLTYLAKGVIAFARGTVSGEGEITWTAGEVDSRGTFSTEGMDFAAAFGPVDRLRGTIEFTDLVNLTTAPDQVIEIGSINPGVEVLSGRVRYSMSGGELISVEDARWPFMGGTLILRPLDINYGSPGPKRYVFEIIGLDAEVFVARMELANISASGIFDGTVPIVFDEDGNGVIEGGLLISRPPGGNLSYVGELTYEDMGAIVNFAFQSLRSLDYSQMSVELNGNLAGEIITRFRFDGVRQGEGAKRNFLTRQLAKLPIRFNVNVRSENFHELSMLVRSYFDSSYLPDPVDRGIGRIENRRLVPINPATPTPEDQDKRRETTEPSEGRRDDEPFVQPAESDNQR